MVLSKSRGNKKSGGWTISGVGLNLVITLLALTIIVLGFSLINKLKTIDESGRIESGNRPDEIIQIEVLNGCGISGIADRFTEYLRARGFDVVKTGNYANFDVINTMVIDRMGKKINAAAVAAELNVASDNVSVQINKEYFLDVTVIIGKDYLNLSPLN